MPFEKGNQLGKGRPPGARQKLSEKFLGDIIEHWKSNGAAALRTACAEEPMEYIKMVASMLPKEATLNVNETITVQSESVQALTGWLESIAGSGDQGKAKNSLPH